MQTFFERLKSNNIFENETFDYKREEIQSFKSIWVTFINCTFNLEDLIIKNIKNPELVIEFMDCTFNCDLHFENCIFERISFENTKSIKSLELNKGLYESSLLKINKFRFANNPELKIKIKADFEFNKIEIVDYFEFENINHYEGKFEFLQNKLGEKEQFKSTSFANSNLQNSFFADNVFNSFTSYYKTTFEYDSEYLKERGAGYTKSGFYRNNFQKVTFSNANFPNHFVFDKCDFKSTTWFENCKNLDNTYLRFVACEFSGFSLFNKSKINYLDINKCTFDKSSSFTDAEFNTLMLFEVKFAGGAYFDEMKINRVIDKSYLKSQDTIILEWKRTLRAIKQELQKTENKIDFNNYRNYELAAHYKELKLSDNFKDTFILWATKWSTNFGSWIWALGFTIISGFSWYCVLYRIENEGSYNPVELENFFNGMFRFFLVSDFSSPFEKNNYLTNTISWIILIIGKIFIAFGIYEMIQSFRKFKA